MKFHRIIDNVQILDLGLLACYSTALFSNLLNQIDHIVLSQRNGGVKRREQIEC